MRCGVWSIVVGTKTKKMMVSMAFFQIMNVDSMLQNYRKDLNRIRCFNQWYLL